jgi:hypothetical protein
MYKYHNDKIKYILKYLIKLFHMWCQDMSTHVIYFYYVNTNVKISHLLLPATCQNILYVLSR